MKSVFGRWSCMLFAAGLFFSIFLWQSCQEEGSALVEDISLQNRAVVDNSWNSPYTLYQEINRLFRYSDQFAVLTGESSLSHQYGQLLNTTVLRLVQNGVYRGICIPLVHQGDTSAYMTAQIQGSDVIYYIARKQAAMRNLKNQWIGPDTFLIQGI